MVDGTCRHRHCYEIRDTSTSSATVTPSLVLMTVCDTYNTCTVEVVYCVPVGRLLEYSIYLYLTGTYGFTCIIYEYAVRVDHSVLVLSTCSIHTVVDYPVQVLYSVRG